VSASSAARAIPALKRRAMKSPTDEIPGWDRCGPTSGGPSSRRHAWARLIGGVRVSAALLDGRFVQRGEDSSVCSQATMPLAGNGLSNARPWPLLCLPVFLAGLVSGASQIGGPARAVAFAWAAVLLSLERLFYVWVWNHPEQFAAWCGRRWAAAPIDALERMFVLFKFLQAAVFVGWCVFHGQGLAWPGGGGIMPAVAGGSLVLVGQFLNYSVFRRLGRVGVFYGIRFGYRVPWSTEFPFSVLKHPQYVGALLSIWGCFLFAQFPQSDWFLLPALETLYYTVGTYLEQ